MLTKYPATIIGIVGIVGVAALSAAACEKGPDLEPAATALQPRGMEDAVVASQNGIQVKAQANQWPGEAEIENEVTPLRIIVQNVSAKPIPIRYNYFRITAADGTTYHAIPPRQVSGVVETDAYLSPTFGYAGFHIAPYAAGYYHGIDPYEGPFDFDYDATYYDTYYPYWQNTALPTSDMIARALPEGVLKSEGTLDGYLYFEKIEKKEGTSLMLHVDIEPEEDEQLFVTLQMPFVID